MADNRDDRSDIGGEEKEKFLTLEFLHDVPLKISVELGRTELKLNDLLMLDKGSTIELAKSAGEPLEFLISGRVAAKGEIVVINEKYGIRLTDIIDPNAKDSPTL